MLLPPLLVDFEPVERDLDEADDIKMIVDRRGIKDKGSYIQIENPVQVFNPDKKTHIA